MSGPYSWGAIPLDTYMDLQSRVWATRDACSKHYPRYCPPDCPNAGKHDADLPDGLCECHQCRTAEADQ